MAVDRAEVAELVAKAREAINGLAAPDGRTVCFARWMQADADGNFTFPRQRPYFYTFKVR